MRPRLLPVALMLCGIVHAPRAPAEQFIMADHVATFPTGKGQLAAFSFWTLQPKVPANWEEPVNYKDGVCHIRYEILEKEHPGPISYQVCWFGNHGNKHVCSEQAKSDGIGVLETEQVPSGMWRNHDTWDWTNAVRRGFIRIYHPEEKHYSDPVYRELKPIKVHVTVTIVSAGSSYRPHGTYGGLHYNELKTLRAVAVYLQHGYPGRALKTALRESESEEPERAAEARRVVDALGAYAETRRTELLETKAGQPLYAAEALAKLAVEFGPSKKARELLAEARAWSLEPAALQEKQARPIYAALKKECEKLRWKLNGKKASDPEMAGRHGAQIAAIANCVGLLRRRFPDTPSRRQAEAIAECMGIPLGDE